MFINKKGFRTQKLPKDDFFNKLIILIIFGSKLEKVIDLEGSFLRFLACLKVQSESEAI